MTVPLEHFAKADEYMPRPNNNTIDISLPGNQIEQRYLVRRIFREAEFEIKESDGEVTVGFITGMDEKTLQVSTTPRNEVEEPLSVLIYWPVAKISETGRKLECLEHENRSKIRSYSHALKAQCERYLNGTHQTQAVQNGIITSKPFIQA